MPYTIPEYIEIKTTTGDTVAFLSPKGDGIKDCYVDNELNNSCTLEFCLPLASDKWAYLTDVYRIYAGGKEFVIQNPDAVVAERDGQKVWGKVKANESWVLLGKDYTDGISNDPSTPNPPWSAVVIVAGGSDLSGARYDVGSAGHALYALLNGSGWTVGTVDVTGTYDLETEKESLLANINKVQETWGGYLVWDSVNKTVSLRSETLWQEYTGYGIYYAKNLKNITRTDDYDIVTRLYPFGENDLNIGTVNSGTIYLDNHSYTDEVLKGIWANQELSSAQQVKDAGEAQLAKICRPRHAYEVKMVDLRSLPGYDHENFDIGHMVDVVDADLGIEAQIRIIKHKYNIFQPWLCEISAGDPIEKIQASIAQTIQMSNYLKSNISNTGFQNLLKAIINTAATQINGASGDYTLIDGVSTWFDRDSVTGQLTGKLVRITPQGLIISEDGGQTWKTAISGKGIHADAGWLGKLNAGVVTIGADTTFESGYDPTQIVAGSSVGMGVDSDCLGLWHFDGSLNSHKGVAADSDALFGGGCFGQALNIATGKHLKVPTTDMLASAGAINFRAKNLSASANGSMLIDLPDNAGNQGMLCGIADDGKLFIEDAKLQFQSVETSQTDFNTGTLSDVQATSAGNVELVRDGQDFTYSETSQADFQSGILTDVTATSVGDLELDKISPTWDLEYAASALPQNSTPAWTRWTYGSGFTEEITSGQLHLANSSSNNIYYSRNGVVTTGNTISVKVKVKISSSTGDAIGLIIDDGSKRVYMWLYTNKITVVDGSNHDYTVDMTSYHEVELRKIAQTGWKLFVDGIERLSGTVQASGSTNWIMFGHALYPNYGESYWDWLNYSLDFNEEYESFGTRIKEVDISGANPAGGTKIEWSKTTPANTAVKVETALSTDGGSTYGSYSEATSGSSIPGITSATDLSNARLKIRETLSTTDTSKTPQLHSLNLYIYVPYKSSGYRYKVYDISAVGSVGSSKITWEENKPASTTLTVKAAVSADGGSTYGSFQTCANGSAIPGLTQGTDVSNTRLKVQEDLTTSDGTKTPQLQSLTIDVGSNVQTAYGPNKSTLTAWDSISLAYKSDRLSLVVNDSEACYIENPGLPAALGNYLYIGTDRNGANAINTLVDELRIDKVYREVNIRTGWHKTGVPFYTSEDMKQWPGYVKVETDGLKIYDSSNNLRGIVGSWLASAIRKYGIQVINGEIYSSVYKTGAATDTSDYAEMGEDASGHGYFKVIGPNGTPTIWMDTNTTSGRIFLYDTAGNQAVYMSINSSTQKELIIRSLLGGIYLGDGFQSIAIGHVNGSDTDGVKVSGNFSVNGNMSCTGSKPAQQVTENYGLRYMYATEAPELVYYDRGTVNLVNGEATVYLDPIYLECIELDTELTPWQIWVQAYGENDVYISEVGADYFKVKERNGGTSNNKVIWKHEAIRAGYAGIRLMEVV